MKKKNYIALIVVMVMLLSVGCAAGEQDERDTTTESQEQQTNQEQQTSQKETEKETQIQDFQTEEPSGTDEEQATEPVVTKTEYDENGNISVIATNSTGTIVFRIDYDAGNKLTTRYNYEYNQAGVLISEFYYEGNGNLIDEFVAENYSNMTGFGENHYETGNDYDVDIAHAFDVTIEKLAPLYAKAEDIWDTYGVAVLIADKVSSYTDGAEICSEYKQIERCLKLIENCLACYPKDFFRDFSDDGVNTDVCIQLVGTGSAPGMYMGGYEHLLLQMDVNCYAPEDGVDDKGSFFCYTLHHELCHMITDKLMDRVAQSQCPLTEEKWNSYNPKGFAYVGYYDDELESKLYTDGDNAEYFIYSYSCSTPDEDRAIIFGNAMAYYQGMETATFNEKVDAKLRYLSDCIKAGFDSTDWPDKMPWEYILDK